nr:hypothetical protein [Tanacetum cinerariifolium]
PKVLNEGKNDDHYEVFAIECQHPEQSESVHKTYLIEQDAHNVIIESVDMNYDSEQIDQNYEDANLVKELQTMNMLNNKCRRSFASPEFLKKAKKANPRLYDIGCYNDNLALMLAPESDDVIRLEKESRSKLSDLIKPFDYTKLNNLYDLFVPQREKSSEQQRFFLERSRISHNNVQNDKKKESFQKQTTLLEKRMDKSIPHLNEEMVVDLRYFNSLELEVDSLTSQLETQKTQFVNEIDRLSREYYYADHMNAILGVYTELDEVTNLQ